MITTTKDIDAATLSLGSDNSNGKGSNDNIVKGHQIEKRHNCEDDDDQESDKNVFGNTS